uniref:Uncharacterized protein n=1 Tax=Graphocephala atropunctata TaxID=36148 RepID=A0A1B6K9G6_9HEMI
MSKKYDYNKGDLGIERRPCQRPPPAAPAPPPDCEPAAQADEPAEYEGAEQMPPECEFAAAAPPPECEGAAAAPPPECDPCAQLPPAEEAAACVEDQYPGMPDFEAQYPPYSERHVAEGTTRKMYEHRKAIQMKFLREDWIRKYKAAKAKKATQALRAATAKPRVSLAPTRTKPKTQQPTAGPSGTRQRATGPRFTGTGRARVQGPFRPPPPGCERVATGRGGAVARPRGTFKPGSQRAPSGRGRAAMPTAADIDAELAAGNVAPQQQTSALRRPVQKKPSRLSQLAQPRSRC